MKNLYLLLLSLLPLVSCSQSKKAENTAQPKPAAVKPEDVFTTLKFELDGKPCIAVINKQYKNYKNKAMFPLSLFVQVNTTDKDQNGHPTEKEAVIFHELQSRIIRELSAAFKYCHVGTTTMNGTRDILLYINSKDQKKASAILNKIRDENKRFASYTFEPDPEWEAVASFYEAVSN
ncbi:DUF695 domain-containing protein [Daejeonella sp.]|uniref:DUF695 domain-containing protein n=1 Tax=Daejeonella sp. TaxID=2805397 RepID=UPI0030C481D4